MQDILVMAADIRWKLRPKPAVNFSFNGRSEQNEKKTSKFLSIRANVQHQYAVVALTLRNSQPESLWPNWGGFADRIGFRDRATVMIGDQRSLTQVRPRRKSVTVGILPFHFNLSKSISLLLYCCHETNVYILTKYTLTSFKISRTSYKNNLLEVISIIVDGRISRFFLQIWPSILRTLHEDRASHNYFSANHVIRIGRDVSLCADHIIRYIFSVKNTYI